MDWGSDIPIPWLLLIQMNETSLYLTFNPCPRAAVLNLGIERPFHRGLLKTI